MATKKDTDKKPTEFFTENEQEVINLINEINGIEAFAHPDDKSHYDAGVTVDRKVLDKDYPLWTSDYYDESIDKTILNVEVKWRSKLYANFYLEKSKAQMMRKQIMQERGKVGSVPLYCCSYVDESTGETIHLVYDIRDILNRNSLSKQVMNDQTVFSGERQGNKIEKEVFRFPSSSYLMKLQKGKPAEYNTVYYEV